MIELGVAVDERGLVRGGPMTVGLGTYEGVARRRTRQPNKAVPVATPAPAPLSFVLHEQIVGGKNHVQVARTGRRYPSPAFARWAAEAVRQIQAATVHRSRPVFPVPARLTLRVEYWPGDRRRRDATALLDALFHVLEKAGVVADDAQIKIIVWMEWPYNGQPPLTRIRLHVCDRWPTI